MEEIIDPKQRPEERLKIALKSDEIEPLYESWEAAAEQPDKLAKKMFRPFLVGGATALLIAGIGVYHNQRTNYEVMHRPEIVEINKIREKQGDAVAQGIVSKNRERYDPAFEADILGKQETARWIYGALGVMLGNIITVFGTISVSLNEATRKRKKLEEILNRQGLSLDILKDSGDGR